MTTFLITFALVTLMFSILALIGGLRISSVRSFFIENYSIYTDEKLEYLVFCFWIKLKYKKIENLVPKLPFKNYYLNLFICPLIKIVYPIYFKQL